MYSPINNYKENKNPYNFKSNNSSKRNLIKDNFNNSTATKKLILSRNIFNNKNYLLKMKNNNSDKKAILNRQLSSDTSPTNANSRQNNTTTNINQTNGKNTNKKGQILLYKKKDNNDFNDNTLYKYLIANDTHHLYNNIKSKNNYNKNSKLDFSMNILINSNQKNDNSAMNIKGDKINSNNRNYYQKFLNINFPLSPISKGIKTHKLNNLNININDYPSSLKNINQKINNISKEKIEKRILSSKKKITNKNISNKLNEINNPINIQNSYICHNTNNINLNVNIINKNTQNDQNNISLSKIKYKNHDLTSDSNLKESFRNKNSQKKIRNKKINKENDNSLYNYSIGNLTSRRKNSIIKVRAIDYNINNNELFNLSSNTINKDINICAETIHFQAVKFMQEIKKIDKNF